MCVYLFLGINGPLFQCCYTSNTVSHSQVGDVGPILDMMAVVLENISTSTIVARATVSAVYLTAKMVSSVPNVSYHKKARAILSDFTILLHVKILFNCLILVILVNFLGIP